MPKRKQDILRDRRSAAIAALGALMILAIAWIVAMQDLHSLSQSLAAPDPTDPLHPRWDAAKRDPATAIHKIHKTEGVILSEIEALTDVPRVTGAFKLKGVARARAPVSEMRYSWILSENVRVRAGETQGLVAGVKAGDRREFEIELEALAPGPHRVIFRAWRMKGGEPVGNSAHYVIDGETPAAQGAARVPIGSPRSPEDMRKNAVQ